jgi:hypothetical protein
MIAENELVFKIRVAMERFFHLSHIISPTQSRAVDIIVNIPN